MPDLLRKIEEIGKNRHGLLKPPPSEAQVRRVMTLGESIPKEKQVLIDFGLQICKFILCRSLRRNFCAMSKLSTVQRIHTFCYPSRKDLARGTGLKICRPISMG